ncbi:hypothetical protein KSP39_PZI000670 [Platanthera zijinensis]|uniref:Myb/SANT-like domain-containing protein n=1 Tax=Platanthera zijinensis TaxID=2320716 RepID=A0AAP0GFP6_9ASPA
MHWTSEMDITLSNALLEQHSLGHKTPNGWKSVAFTAAMTALKDICGIETSKEKVMARLKTWNKYYIEVSAMLATSGFGWDWQRNMVQVDSEEVWANYVKAHPSVKHYKDKVIVNWSDLAVLCGTDRATGSHAATATEMAKEIDAESMAEKTTNTQEETRTGGEGSSRRRRKRPVGADAVAVAIEKLADSVDKAAGGKSASNVDEIYVALAQMTDLDRGDFLKAMDILCHDNVKRDIFMRLPDDMKGVWLRMQFER